MGRAVPADLAGGGRGQAAQQAQQARLADAVGAGHVEPCAAFERAVHALEEEAFALGAGEVVEGQHGGLDSAPRRGGAGFRPRRGFPRVRKSLAEVGLGFGVDRVVVVVEGGRHVGDQRLVERAADPALQAIQAVRAFHGLDHFGRVQHQGKGFATRSWVCM